MVLICLPLSASQHSIFGATLICHCILKSFYFWIASWGFEIATQNRNRNWKLKSQQKSSLVFQPLQTEQKDIGLGMMSLLPLTFKLAILFGWSDVARLDIDDDIAATKTEKKLLFLSLLTLHKIKTFLFFLFITQWKKN